MRFRLPLIAGVLAMCYVVVIVYSYHVGFTLKVSRVYRENGLIENLQGVLLVLSAIAFLVCVRLDARANRWLMCAYAFVCYSLLVREIEIVRFDVPEVVKMAMTGRGRAAIFIVILVVLAIYGLRDVRTKVVAGLQFAKSIRGYLVYAAVACLVAAHVLEEATHARHEAYIEEIIELGGYGLLFLASLPSSLSRRTPATPEPRPIEPMAGFEPQVLA